MGASAASGRIADACITASDAGNAQPDAMHPLHSAVAGAKAALLKIVKMAARIIMEVVLQLPF